METIDAYAAIITIILIISLSFNMINSKDKTLDKFQQLLKKADQQCANKKMTLGRISIQDFSHINYTCYTKSPYYEVVQNE